MARLARRAAGRLATMSQGLRAEVIRLLDVLVKPLGPGRTPPIEILARSLIWGYSITHRIGMLPQSKRDLAPIECLSFTD